MRKKKLRKAIHGEVVIVEVKEIPETAKRLDIKEKHFVIGESSTIGNDHRIAISNAVAILEDEENNRYIDNSDDTEVFCPKSERHSTIMLPASKWQIKKAQEFDYANQQTRAVVD